jgi:pantothenate kinase
VIGFEEAAARVLRRLDEPAPHRPPRVLIGIAGEPGAGKTTLAERLLADLAASGRSVAHVPMDGFHLADAALQRLGRLQRKGAIDTFDGWGYRELLRRLGQRGDEPVYAPDFERTLEQPIAGSIEVGPAVEVVVTEGNYLLADEEPWRAARSLLTETWFCVAPQAVRTERLVARHIRFGRTQEQATAWVRDVDEPNAVAIAATRRRADVEVDTGGL